MTCLCQVFYLGWATAGLEEPVGTVVEVGALCSGTPNQPASSCCEHSLSVSVFNVAGKSYLRLH